MYSVFIVRNIAYYARKLHTIIHRSGALSATKSKFCGLRESLSFYQCVLAPPLRPLQTSHMYFSPADNTQQKTPQPFGGAWALLLTISIIFHRQ